MPRHGERLAPSGELTLCLEEFGDEDAEPLLLIAGLGVQMLVFHDELCEALAGHHLRVIRFDQRDVGRSSRLDAACPDPLAELRRAVAGEPFVAPYRLQDMAGDALAVLDATRLDSAHVFGASMGGAIAQVLAADHPERVRSLISMMSSARAASPPADLAHYLGPEVQERSAWVAADVAGWRAMRGGGFAFDEDGMRAMSERAFDRGFDREGPARQLLAILASGDRLAALARIRAPALVIHGDADPLVPLAAGREVAEQIAGARFEVVPGLGHELPRDAWPLLVNLVVTHIRSQA